mgnify:CR=1 FL=1
MPDISLQDVFDRVFIYLRASGIEMTVKRYRTLLHLIEESVASAGESDSGEQLLDAAMDLIPRHFDLPAPESPEAAPPVYRGSIGYGRDD